MQEFHNAAAADRLWFSCSWFNSSLWYNSGPNWIWHCNNIVMPGCTPGPSPQQMYCNRSKPLSQNHRFDKKPIVLWCFSTAAYFVQILVLKYTRNGQLGGQYLHVWQGGRYHADVEIWGLNRWFDEKLAVLWSSDHCRTFHSAPIVNCTENWPLPVNSRSRVNMFGKEAYTMRMFIAKYRIAADRQDSD